jgi:hypothetical protein
MAEALTAAGSAAAERGGAAPQIGLRRLGKAVAVVTCWDERAAAGR